MTDRYRRLNELLVLGGGERAGRLRRLGSRGTVFNYDDAYLASPTAVPVSTRLPLTHQTFGHEEVANWLLGLMPNNPRVVQSWQSRFGVSGQGLLELLATPVGLDCAGALQFCERGHEAAAVSRRGRLRWVSDEELTAHLDRMTRQPELWMWRDTDIDSRGCFSLAGAQSKVALVRTVDGHWGRPTGSHPTTHILKPGIQRFDLQAVVEHVTMRACRIAGLPTARTEVVELGSFKAILVERYDRARDSAGRFVRIHQEDLCQAAGVPAHQKYQHEGGPSPQDIATILRQVSANPASDIRRLLDAQVFNWVTLNGDAHSKNFSLIIEPSGVRLAPLYDVCSELPYRRSARDIPTKRLSMRIGSDYTAGSADSNPQVWDTFGRSLGLAVGESVSRARRIVDVLPDAFNQAVKTLSPTLRRTSTLQLLLNRAINRSRQQAKALQLGSM